MYAVLRNALSQQKYLVGVVKYNSYTEYNEQYTLKESMKFDFKSFYL